MIILPKPKEILIHSGESLPLGGLRIEKKIANELSEQVGDEGYKLRIHSDGVSITAATDKGLFYGEATLKQILDQSVDGRIPLLEIRDWPDMSIRGLHLDLRSQRPSMAYFKDILQRLAGFKINLVVIEYEDYFPYSIDKLIPSSEAFSTSEVKEIDDYAKQLNIEIVPLQQSLGHLGYVLKHNHYAHLRERADSVDMLCPQNPDVYPLLERLIKDMVDAHPGGRYVHIGADETYLLGECPKCKAFVQEKSKSRLYVEHIAKVCEIVKKLGRQPMLWGDMLISYPEYISALPADTIIHHWDYYSYGDEPNYIDNGYFGEEKITPMGPGFKLYDKLRSLGLPIIAGPSSRCAPDTSFNVDHLFHLKNIAGLCRKVADTEGIGMINTSWANAGEYTTCRMDIGGEDCQVIDAKLTNRRLPLEYNWYGLAAAAAYSWTSATQAEEYRDGFNKCFFGTSADIAEILHLLDGRPQSMEQYPVIREQVLKAIGLLAQVSDVGRNRLAFDFIKIAARLIEHKCRRDLAFRQYEVCLSSDPATASTARAALEKLRKEEADIRLALTEVWRNCFSEYEIEQDLYAHFSVSDVKYERYLGASKGVQL